MRPILCAIDLSESSSKVLSVASYIAKGCNTHVIVLYAYRLIDREGTGDIAALKRRLENQAKEKFEQLKETFALNDKIYWEFQPEVGFLAPRIKTYVERNNISMIVMSELLANALNDLKLVTLQRFITDSKLPFVIVPEEVNVEVL